MSKYKISEGDLLVLYDDYDLPKGKLRIRAAGSAGTHNGMRNIVLNLGSCDFPRVRIGFKPDSELKMPLVDYVLSGIRDEDRDVMENSVDRAGDVAVAFANGTEFEKIMQKFNGKTVK